MPNTRFFSFLLTITAFSFGIFGQPATVVQRTAISNSGPQQFLPLSELKEGMRGTARTVFRGDEAEEFSVEILGVVPGAIGPKQDLIVGRLSGGGADRTGVFAGMSGSPVYINGKLVGAISYAFPFSKEPICGITPIEQMISIFEHKPTASTQSEPRAVSFGEIASASFEPAFPSNGAANAVVSGVRDNSLLMAVAGQTFQPIATPVTFNGFKQEALNLFAPQLMSAGLMPVTAVGGAAAITPMKTADATTLVGGDSVSMQLTRGDYSLAAAGTVTYRDGDKIYAFGHPFLSLGSSDLPMSESHVVTVIPNLNNSFKLAVPDAMVGSMTQDRATGVFGSLGRPPGMIPVRIDLRSSRGQSETINFEVAKDDFLTPLLMNMSVYNTLIAQERALGDATVTIDGEIRISGQQPVKIERRFAGAQAGQMASASVASPIAVLMRSRFDDLAITGIQLNLSSTDGSRVGVLDRISVDRTRVKAGETVEVQAYARTNSGRVFVQRIPIIIPADTPAGALTIAVGDGNAIQQNAPIQQLVPRDLRELIATINKIKRGDRLYVQTSRTTSGVIIGASEMPNLPPSMLATLNNDRTSGGVRPSVQTVISETAVAPAEFILTGQQTLAIEVIK